MFFLKSSWSSPRLSVLRLCPGAPSLLAHGFHCLLCTGRPLIHGSSLFHSSGGSQIEATGGRGSMPSTAAYADKSLTAVSDNNQVWICLATRVAPEAGTGGGEKGSAGGG